MLLQTEEQEARLRQLERELSVADILLYRSVAQRQQEAAAEKARLARKLKENISPPSADPKKTS